MWHFINPDATSCIKTCIQSSRKSQMGKLSLFFPETWFQGLSHTPGFSQLLTMISSEAWQFQTPRYTIPPLCTSDCTSTAWEPCYRYAAGRTTALERWTDAIYQWWSQVPNQCIRFHSDCSHRCIPKGKTYIVFSEWLNFCTHMILQTIAYAHINQGGLNEGSLISLFVNMIIQILLS